jgi:hypothetical protein
MEDQRFDRVARELGACTSRRQMLKSVAGGVLGGLLGLSAVRSSSAAPDKKRPVAIAAACTVDADCGPGERCDVATQTCERRGGGNGQGGPCQRGSACTSDATCCGGEVCDSRTGVCVSAGGPCTNVDGTCFDTLDCCGAETCVSGMCQQTTGGGCSAAACAADADCCGGKVCINNACVKAARPSGCPEGMVRCSGTCVDALRDRNNCGACGNVCGEQQPCTNGTCGGGAGPGLCSDPSFTCDLPCHTAINNEEGPGCICYNQCRGSCRPCDETTNDCVVEPTVPCGPCQYAMDDYDNGTCICVDQCDACSSCSEFGECVVEFTCGPCEYAADDGTGVCSCFTTCDPCSACDPDALECVSVCEPDTQNCDWETATCV